MKVGIVTWVSYYNYGTFLQAYALQRILESLNVCPKLIDDRQIIDIPIKRKRYLTKYLPSSIFKYVFNLYRNLRQTKYERRIELIVRRKFETFKKSYLNVVSNRNKFDCYVVGSDQIWSPHYPLYKDYFQHYFVGNRTGLKIAYAPSLRVPENGQSEYADFISEWVNDFQCLSAREPHGVSFLKSVSTENVELVLDPTLLLSKEEWIQSLHLSISKDKDYCLCYFLTYRPEVFRYVKEYADKMNLSLRIILTDDFPRELINEEIEIPSPKEFLELILNSNIVVTDSFHASVFSTIFGTPYVIYQRFVKGKEVQQNSRITNFLSLIESDNGLVMPNSAFESKDIHHDNLESEVIISEIAKSKEFLRKGLAINH